MPLDAAGLETDLAAFFANPPITIVDDVVDVTTSRADCAQEWADAMQAYAAAIVPASTGVAAAAAVLKTSLATAFALESAAGSVSAAFATFAASVGSGMAGFTAVPPPGSLGVVALLATPQSTHAAAAAAWATQIDTWMKTGTATPIPSGSPANWS